MKLINIRILRRRDSLDQQSQLGGGAVEDSLCFFFALFDIVWYCFKHLALSFLVDSSFRWSFRIPLTLFGRPVYEYEGGGQPGPKKVGQWAGSLSARYRQIFWLRIERPHVSLKFDN